MATKKYWTFVVEGRGHFPTDMLRRDRCCPYQQEDVGWMDGTHMRSVKLISHVGPPNVERWGSFDWSVDLIKEEKA